jgi:uncharacterized protein involved in outer membrane biogenesis
MSNFLIALAVCLITVISALFAIPHVVDWNGYRSVFEDEATRLLGREVRVGGGVNLHFLPTPYFRFEKVRIADTPDNLQDSFFRADSLTVKLAIAPFFRGIVEANEIEFQRPVLRVALNEKGEWNWQSFGQAIGRSTYLPNVALTSLKIRNGVLAMHGPGGQERMRLEGMTGELSAPALDGPYRYRGTYGKSGSERELRLATTRPEPDGSVRFRLLVRGIDDSSTYTIDGRLVELTGKPRVDGEFTAHLPTAGLWQKGAGQQTASPQQKSRAGSSEEAQTGGPGAAFDLKANLRADAEGARLSDLALSFEQDGRPQLITGGVNADWRDSLAFELTLSSRWLDLDRIAGVADDAGPLETLVPFATKLQGLLPADGRSRASFTVDQANIGREAISDLRIRLTRSKETLEVKELRATMPGGSRGELQGVVSGPPDAPVFNGNVNLRGSSLARFVAWATGNALPASPKGDGAFGIRSQLSIGHDHATARDVVGDLSGTAVNGQAQYRWEGRPELSVLIEGPQLDARAFLPAGLTLGDAADLLTHGWPGAAAGTGLVGGRQIGWRGPQMDVIVRVNAGQLLIASRAYRDVALEIEVKGGNIRLPLLRLSGDDGLSLELEGEVQNAASRSKGSVRAALGAQRAQAIGPLAELLGIPEGLRPDQSRAQVMAPLRMAASMTFGMRTATSIDLMLDGEAGGTSVKVNGRLDGSAAGWRNGPADVTAYIASTDAVRVAALLAPATTFSRSDGAGPGRALFKASGIPTEGLSALADIEAGDLGLRFRGQLTAADSGNKLSGDLELKTADAARLAALVGLAPLLRLEGMPVAGTLRLVQAGGAVNLERLSLKLAGSDVKGQIALSPAGERQRLQARLDIDELSAAKLLAPLLDQRLAVTGAAEAALSGRQSPWPAEPFDMAALDHLEGTIQLSTKRLLLSEGLPINEAAVDVRLDSGKVDVTRLEGTGLGGRVIANGRIEKTAAGAEVTGQLQIAGGRLEALLKDRGSKPTIRGSLSGEFKFAGRGTTPHGIISALQGGGSLALSDATLAALWPGAIGLAVESALKAEADKVRPAVTQGLAEGLSAGRLPLPDKLQLEIVDGRLRLKPIAIDTTHGRTSGAASLDLRTLQFDAEWRLEQTSPAAGPGERGALPAVIVSYRGVVTAPSDLEPRINSDAFERELSVRRMERDVEELERLRRLDETRRRSEAERLRQQLEQAPPAVPVAPAVPTRPASPG